jgi:RNA polymerase sigma-B factor
VTMPSRAQAGDRADSALEDLDAAALAYAERRESATPTEAWASREKLVCYCLPFAGRLARRYRGRGEYLEDLEQVARLGLIKAIDRYDPERGSFTAYAVITISGELKRHFRDRTWGVHVPRRVQDLSLEVGHASMLLTSILARDPTTGELAARIGVTEAAVLEAVESAAGYSPASLNVPIAGDGTTEFGDLLGGLDADLESVTDKLTVADLLLRLPIRERRMLAMRFYGNRTQAEIADELGISQMHVSRLLSRALTWLREAMLSDDPPHWEGDGRARVIAATAKEQAGQLSWSDGWSDGELTPHHLAVGDRKDPPRIGEVFDEVQPAAAGGGDSGVDGAWHQPAAVADRHGQPAVA